MREILFKAKRIDNGEWVEGSYIKSQPINEYARTIASMFVFNDVGERELIHIDESTLCQYTGLTDKNGNRIWENDVVRCQDVIGKIGWNETHLAYTILAEVEESMRYYYIDESLSSDIEVIGNAFDNPELMNTTETIGYADNGSLMSAT